MAGDGWVLVGDAFGFLDPLYSSGVLLALKSGELAADAIVDGLARAATPAPRSWARGAPSFNQGVDRMRRLVCEYYDGFSFGKFVQQVSANSRGTVTDLLIGDLFTDRVDKVWGPMESLYAPESSRPSRMARRHGAGAGPPQGQRARAARGTPAVGLRAQGSRLKQEHPDLNSRVGPESSCRALKP